MIAKTSPTACSETTPSRSRAPPECHSPTTGQPVGQRALVGGEDRPRSRPRPSRRPGSSASEANATDRRAVDAADRGEHAASRPPAVISSSVPSSKNCREPGQRVARVVGAWSTHDLRPGRRVGGGHAARSGTARATLWPPKPNELFSAEQLAVGQLARLAADDVEVDVVVGVVEVDRRRGHALVQREHGGDAPRPRRRRRAGDRSSTWSPRRTTPSAASPSAARIACASATSPTGVEVAWALMWTTSDGVSAGVLERHARMARAAPAPTGSGCGDVVGVGGDAGAGDLARRSGAAGPRVLERSRARGRRRPRRARSRRGPCRRGARRAPARRCGWTAPASRRSRPAAAGGSRPRCRRRRRRRRGRVRIMSTA